MDLIVTLNKYLHDFSAALWVATIFVGWLLKRSHGEGGCARCSAAFRGLNKLFWGSFTGVICFGAIRALAYRRYEWVDELGDSQITFLLVKHAVFTVLVVGGIAYWLRLRKLTADG